MARHVDVHMVDDLTGSVDDVKTVSFTYGSVAGVRKGYQYEMELSADSRHEFDLLMEPYLKVARRKRGNPSTGGKLGRDRSAVVRAWAMENGLLDATKTHGRLPASIIQKYMDELGEKAFK